MFDIGFSELVLLMVVGLVVLGPQRLPVAIKTVMGWVRTIRGLANSVQNELKQELKLQELQDSIKKAEQLNLNQLSPELSKTVEELKEQANKMRAELEQKAAAANTSVEEQIQEMKKLAESMPMETVSQPTDTTTQTAEKPVTTSSETAVELAQSAETIPATTPKIETELTALSAAEQAELTERLSDYYPPDDIDVSPAPTNKS